MWTKKYIKLCKKLQKRSKYQGAAVYEEIALKLLPLGSKPSIVVLREKIAIEIAKAVEKGIKDNLPAETKRAMINVRERELAIRQYWVDSYADMERRERELVQNEETFKRISKGYLGFLNAVEKWADFCCDGVGQVEDHQVLWEAVKAAREEYHSL